MMFRDAFFTVLVRTRPCAASQHACHTLRAPGQQIAVAAHVPAQHCAAYTRQDREASSSAMCTERAEHHGGPRDAGEVWGGVHALGLASQSSSRRGSAWAQQGLGPRRVLLMSRKRTGAGAMLQSQAPGDVLLGMRWLTAAVACALVCSTEGARRLPRYKRDGDALIGWTEK